MKKLFLLLLTFVTITPSYAQKINAEAEKKASELVSKMTLDEKIDYISGYNTFYIRAVPRLGIPEIRMADGPQGIRNNTKSTMYPAGILSASTWNRSLINELGKSLGKDAKARGVHILLGPGVNIYRAPMCGRNFEYFGEDPYLTGEIAKQYILGVQSENVIATVKHFAGNNQEWDRLNVSSDIDERTLHEIYFPAFEKAIKEANVGAVMTSYNLVNGVHASENKELNIGVLRDLWKHKGIVMSDWTSVYSTVGAANGGLDLEMPKGIYLTKEYLLPAIKKGLVEESTIDEKVKHILQTIISFGFLKKEQQDSSIPLDRVESKDVALNLAREGIVLLKNEGSILPLKKERITLLGHNANQIPTGGGSGFVTPYTTVSTFEGLKKTYKGKVAFVNDSLLYKDISEEFVSNGFKAEYFSNKDLKGTPDLVKQNQSINFSWDEEPLLSSSNSNDFSARWTATYKPSKSGVVKVRMEGRDGYRLLVDNQRIISAWYNGEKSRSHYFEVEAHKEYEIKVEYNRNNSKKANLLLEAKILDEASLDQYVNSYTEAIVLCVGYDGESEFEASDREFALPLWQEFFINKVAEKGKKIIAVVNAGGGVDFSSWEDKVQAILMAWYPGQEGGQAIAEILAGEISPSGKLPISIENKWEDSPTYHSYYESINKAQTRPIVHKRVQYSEGVFLGYRGYDLSGVAPRYSFGHGLSYSTFSYTDLQLYQKGDKLEVSFTIKNTGKMDASEVVQVYVRDIESSVPRPLKELKGFEKVNLKKGESKRVMIELDKRAFSFYSTQQKDFIMEYGEFEIMVGSGSTNLPLKNIIKL